MQTYAVEASPTGLRQTVEALRRRAAFARPRPTRKKPRFSICAATLRSWVTAKVRAAVACRTSRPAGSAPVHHPLRLTWHGAAFGTVALRASYLRSHSLRPAARRPSKRGRAASSPDPMRLHHAVGLGSRVAPRMWPRPFLERQPASIRTPCLAYRPGSFPCRARRLSVSAVMPTLPQGTRRAQVRLAVVVYRQSNLSGPTVAQRAKPLRALTIYTQNSGYASICHCPLLPVALQCSRGWEDCAG